MFMKWLFTIAVLVASVGQVQAGLIISQWQLGVIAHDGSIQAAVENRIVTLPLSATQTATTPGGATGTASHSYAVSGSSGTFDMSFDLQRTGGLPVNGDISKVSLFGDIHFQVTEASVFDASGLISLSGSGRIRSDFSLRGCLQSRNCMRK